MNEEQFLRRLAAEAEDTVALLSSPRRAERERRVCAAFLRCAGVPFSPSDLRCPENDPPDVCFGEAAFEVKMLLGDRRIHAEWKALAVQRRDAQCLDALIEPVAQPEPFSFGELVRMVAGVLTSQAYDPRTRAVLDALVYVNLKGRFFDAHSPLSDTSQLEQMAWRSVSALSPPYALVLTGSATSPAFLYERIGRVQPSCDCPDDWFEL